MHASTPRLFKHPAGDYECATMMVEDCVCMCCLYCVLWELFSHLNQRNEEKTTITTNKREKQLERIGWRRDTTAEFHKRQPGTHALIMVLGRGRVQHGGEGEIDLSFFMVVLSISLSESAVPRRE